MKHRSLAGIIAFTDNGREISEKIIASTENICFLPKQADTNIDAWIQECFGTRTPIVFIGATGIAVRLIAPYVTDKLHDCPVVVVDELGRFIIPILSGHYGGANELAAHLSKGIGATLVITTATDINNAFSIDVFAKKNSLSIFNKGRIKMVSKKALSRETIKYKCDALNVTIKGEQPQNIIVSDDECDFYITDMSDENKYYTDNNSLILYPRRIVIGIGCKKGKSFEELRDFVLSNFVKSGLFSFNDKVEALEYLENNLYAITSIDVKSDEIGLLKLAQFFGAKSYFYTPQELNELEGDFPSSDFVLDTVGTSNVCERSAAFGAGLLSRDLLISKIAENGMTMAVAIRKSLEAQW